MNYSHPEVLVDTKWVEDHLNDPKVRIAEVDYDPTANYVLGHVPGSVLLLTMSWDMSRDQSY